MVCRQLGFAGGALSATTSAGFGPGSGKILMDNVDCHGNERRLKLCNHVGWGQYVCNHGENAGVLCIFFGNCFFLAGFQNTQAYFHFEK